MSSLPATQRPPVELGLLSLVLGAVALLVFFLPILGLPIGVLGLLMALSGFVSALRAGGLRLRWTLLGCTVCTLALAVNLAITYAPGGYQKPPMVPEPWQPIPGRPTVSPPASAMGMPD